jgi:lipoate-protein ligase A
MLQILNTGLALAEENMRMDEELLNHLQPEGDPILHLYRWNGPSATYGYFINPSHYFHPNQNQVRLAQRPTGGGILFHTHDYAFSLLVPSKNSLFSINTIDNYKFVNQVVLDSVKEIFALPDELYLTPSDFSSELKDAHRFCMAKPTQYDVIHQDLKIAGAAQRRKAQGFLHQGTISLAIPDPELIASTLLNTELFSLMQRYTFAPLGAFVKQDILDDARDALEKKLIQNMRTQFS